jgi:hypothetical protein
VSRRIVLSFLAAVLAIAAAESVSPGSYTSAERHHYRRQFWPRGIIKDTPLSGCCSLS